MVESYKRVSGKRLIGILESFCWYVHRIRGSHHVMRHDDLLREQMSSTNGREIEYRVVLSRDSEKNWLVSVPAFPGCHTFGSTRKEALTNAREAIEACLESLTASGDGLPESDVPVEVEVVRVVLPAA